MFSCLPLASSWSTLEASISKFIVLIFIFSWSIYSQHINYPLFLKPQLQRHREEGARAVGADSADLPWATLSARVRALLQSSGHTVHWSPLMCFSYLLPHLLPSKPGLDTHGMRHPTANTIQRVFKMSFVPVGFWQRFIARMLISLAEMDLQVAAVSAQGDVCEAPAAVP